MFAQVCFYIILNIYIFFNPFEHTSCYFRYLLIFAIFCVPISFLAKILHSLVANGRLLHMLSYTTNFVAPLVYVFRATIFAFVRVLASALVQAVRVSPTQVDFLLLAVLKGGGNCRYFRSKAYSASYLMRLTLFYRN